MHGFGYIDHERNKWLIHRKRLAHIQPLRNQMKTLLYNRLNPKKIPNFQKVRGFLESNDFRSAEVKKVGDNLYRARLDKSNRLLFAIYRHAGEAYILLLEWIVQHAYDKSRFLRRGAVIDSAKVPVLEDLSRAEGKNLIYLNPALPSFNLLDKVISFDDDQNAVYASTPPLIVIGSAGSGKTALILEKMKEAVGNVLYVTRSPYLVQNSRNLYYALDYENDAQSVDFLSFEEYLCSIQVPRGREMPYNNFAAWFARHRPGRGLRDPQQLFEEFKGVITGPPTDNPWLSREAYLELGVKQSIFDRDEREQVYDLFTRYLTYMKEEDYYDANILSHQYLGLVQSLYDFVVVDEVQDLTNIQLQLILKSLNEPHQFILCGDSNQIVHPNFFSWAKLKSFFYLEQGPQAPAELIRILQTNYRNSLEITELANRILKLKNARFGSIDRESNYLVRTSAPDQGAVLLLSDSGPQCAQLNDRTRNSTHFAVIVMHPDQKQQARQHFHTPLVFSIQEAKGLEYESIILYNFASDDVDRFREITRDVSHEELAVEDLGYARARDKSDKSLEIYKFYINALYVAVTRAVSNIYIIERDTRQSLFDLLGLTLWDSALDLGEQRSSLEEWRQEAHRLEQQGKQQQADEIRSEILKLDSVPWKVLQGEALDTLQHDAIDNADRKARLLLFEYALVYHDRKCMTLLAQAEFRPALNPERGTTLLNKKYFVPYGSNNPAAITRLIDQYGLDYRDQFNQTPLMIATRLGNQGLVKRLVEMGADTSQVNNMGLNAFQIALEQACEDEKYASKKLAGVYAQLVPENTVIQAAGRLFKLDNHLMEFVLFNLMVAMFYTRLGENAAGWGYRGFSTVDFMEPLAHFPDSIMPDRRKKRPYISSILSKNEVDRDDKYNRHLFRRISQGNYIIDPELSVRLDNRWVNIYDLLLLDQLGHKYRKAYKYDYFGDVNNRMEENLERFRQSIKNFRAAREAERAADPPRQLDLPIKLF